MKLGDFEAARRRARETRAASLVEAIRRKPSKLAPETLSASDRLRHALGILGAGALALSRDEAREILMELDDWKRRFQSEREQRRATAPTAHEEMLVRERLARDRRRWLRERHGVIPLRLMDVLELREALEDASRPVTERQPDAPETPAPRPVSQIADEMLRRLEHHPGDAPIRRAAIK